jgi:branched-chain amino acid transport system substrate-binding protein
MLKNMMKRFAVPQRYHNVFRPDPAVEAENAIDRRRFLAGAGTVATGGGVLAASMLADLNGGAKAATGTPIPIGVPLPLTGGAATDGINSKKGMEWACETLNAEGGILGRPVEPHFIDTKNQSADEVSSAVKSLIDRNKVHAIITFYNIGSNEAEYEPIADAGIIYMHCNTAISHQNLVMKDPNRYFGCFMSDPAEYWYGVGYPVMLESLVKSGLWKPDNNKLAVIAGSLPYSTVIANAMKEHAPKHGFEVVFSEVVNVPTTEWGPVLEKVRQIKPAAIANTHFFVGDIAQCQVQFAQNPTNSLFYYQYGALLKSFSEIAGDAAEGVLTSSVLGVLPDAFGNAFAKRARDKFGNDVELEPVSAVFYELYHYALCAAFAGGTGEPGNDKQNRKIAANLKRFTFRGADGTYWYHPEWNSCVPYPIYTKDASMGTPYLLFQIQDPKAVQPRKLIYPEPYNDGAFKIPHWFK